MQSDIAGAKVIMGNHAVSYGAQLAKVQVIAAYPITPQTQIVEMLSELCANGLLDAEFIKVESEHSAMAAVIGAATAGARAFTATSSHGLALMHEMLHWAAGARLPIVMANVNRALGPGWSIWADQNDSLSQRDTGWMQIYCESNQEVLDTMIQAYKIAEAILLPLMVVLDAFVLSHTYEPVSIPEPALVDRFLPPRQAQYKLNVQQPCAFNGLLTPDYYMEMRYKMQKAMEQAHEVIQDVDREYNEMFGRHYGLVEEYRLDDADVALVTSGTITSTARDVVDVLRAEGRSIGLLKIRVFRPFPTAEVRKSLSHAGKIAVIDRNISFGHGGIFAQEVRSALYGGQTCPIKGCAPSTVSGAPPAAPGAPSSAPGGFATHQEGCAPLFSFVVGLGGRDVTPTSIRGMASYVFEHDGPPEDIIWWEVKK